MSKIICLVALAAAAHVHAVEHDTQGNVIPADGIRFVSSDDTLFTVTTNADNPLAADLCGLREGSGVLSVYDDADNLHVSYDVLVSPAVPVELELQTDTGETIDPAVPAVVAVEGEAVAETFTDAAFGSAEAPAMPADSVEQVAQDPILDEAPAAPTAQDAE